MSADRSGDHDGHTRNAEDDGLQVVTVILAKGPYQSSSATIVSSVASVAGSWFSRPSVRSTHRARFIAEAILFRVFRCSGLARADERTTISRLKWRCSAAPSLHPRVWPGSDPPQGNNILG
jgi:hypothetical protein